MVHRRLLIGKERMQQDIWFQKYKILGLLGKGGNAEVYLAEHIKLNSFRAIKCISKSHPLYDLQCKEALILKNLKHSCIPIIYDIEENEDGSYIVEQYIEGETLRSYVLQKGPVREKTIVRFGLQLCDLMSYLHTAKRPVLYVDLKPENIIVAGMTLKLIDFGSAIYRDEPENHPGYYATRGYAAPELYGNDIIDERCDVYGIGMLMYFMALGQDVKNDSGFENIDSVGRYSKRLKKIINNCLKFSPSQRYTSVAGLSRELSTMQQGNHFHVKQNRFLRIALAGSQPRIGVTHLALRLSLHLINQGFRCLYQEENHSQGVRTVKACYEDVDFRKGIPVIRRIPMLASDSGTAPDLENYDVTILDFGSLSEDNLPEFLNADIKLLILGSKDWELPYSEQAIKLTAEYKDINYLFNFISGSQFQQIMKSMGQKNCSRIPYEPDPYAKTVPANGLDFFREILSPVLTAAGKGSRWWKGR